MNRTLTLIAAAALTGSVARADQIDRALVYDGAAVTQAVRGLGAEKVAVLKFDVKTATQASNFQAGLANAKLAQKLENLLILTNNPKDPLFVLSDAAEASASLPPNATWRTPEGRAALAKLKKLPLAWDSSQALNPDGFVTGELAIAPDGATTTVTLYGFTAAHPTELRKLHTVAPPPAAGRQPLALASDRSILALAGISYAVSHAGSGRAVADKAAAAQASRQFTEPTSFTRAVKEGPVRLDVVVNGEVVDITADADHPGGGRFSRSNMKEPKEGDVITFRLTNTSDTRTYAVLLAVNCRNTNSLGKESSLNNRDAKDQELWVLGPKEAVSIKGFYTDRDQGSVEEFRVLGDQQSKSMYTLMSGEYRGLITMYVFGERSEKVATTPTPSKPKSPNPKVDEPPAPKFATGPVEKEEVEISMLSLGMGGSTTDVQNSGSLEKAQQKLAAKANVTVGENGRIEPDASKMAMDRGLIVPGTKRTGDGPIQAVPFKLDPNPLSFVQMRYYQPK